MNVVAVFMTQTSIVQLYKLGDCQAYIKWHNWTIIWTESIPVTAVCVLRVRQSTERSQLVER